jgi:hypothetical protein
MTVSESFWSKNVENAREMALKTLFERSWNVQDRSQKIPQQLPMVLEKFYKLSGNRLQFHLMLRNSK